jgi:hypothetical protein
LDLDPVNIVSEEKSFENESAINAHFARFYADMLSEGFQISSSDYNNSGQWDRFEYYTGYGVSRKNEDAIDKQGERISGNMGYLWWNYSAVRNINEFIILIDKYAGNFNDEKVKAWKSEAKVIRAWYYYTMAKRYGGMPIITEPQEIVNETEAMMTPRASEKETWDFILKDIDDALNEGLKEEAESEGRLYKNAALTLRAQAALYAASIARYNTPISGIGDHKDPNTGKQICGIPSSDAEYYYEIAFNASKEVIESQKHQLARNLDENGSDNFAKLFLNIDKHTEDIFVKYYQKPEITHLWDYYRLPSPYGIGSMMDNPTLDLVDMYDNLDGTFAAITVNQGEWLSDEYNTSGEIFQNRDYRLGGTIYYPGGKFPSGTFEVWRGIINNGTLVDGNGTTTVNGITYPNRGKFGMGSILETQTGFLLRKYIDENNIANVSQTNPSYQPWISMRYAEVLLIAAEAAAELGVDHNNIGLNSLNDIRTRAGLPEVNSLTNTEVRKQWVCEFAFENVVFWCKRRWRTLSETLTDNYTCSGLEPYWDITNNKWKFKKIVACNYPKNSFLDRYYYNWINDSQITTNPKIYQNYGY